MVAIFDYYARLSLIMLQIIKSLGVLIVAVVFFAACGEALVSQVGGDIEKAAGGCENGHQLLEDGGSDHEHLPFGAHEGVIGFNRN